MWSGVLNDPVAQVHGQGRFDSLEKFELHVAHVERLTHRCATGEQHRGHVDRELVDEPSGEVLLAALGTHLANTKIANRLHISVRTVESHVQSLLRA
jgi:hypothetical protein